MNFQQKHYAYSTGHFVLHDFLSTFMIMFFMLVDTLFTQCALKCKKMRNTDDVIKCRKCATQMISSYGREARNDQSNRRIDYSTVSNVYPQSLTLKTSLEIAADGKLCDIFPNFRKNKV